MKKLISIILTITIIASMFIGVSIYSDAATVQITGGNSKNTAVSINYATEYALVLTEQGTKWFKFTTNSTENYWYNIFLLNVSVGNNNGFSGVSATILDSFDEQFATSYSFNSKIGESGAKLEANTTYYLAVYGVRAGTIKFHLDYAFDQYGETNTEATNIKLNTIYESSIDARGSLADDREADHKNGDVDVVKFNSGNNSSLYFSLFNGNIEYYNSYFEGVCANIKDSFGQSVAYIEIRPDGKGTYEVKVSKNTTYYIKFFATSGGTGNYKYIIESEHDFTSRIITASTCYEQGEIEYTCSRCAYSYSERIPESNHSYGSWQVNYLPTCCDTGSESRYCKYCGDEQTRSIEATGIHSWNNGSITRSATCTASGIKTYECRNCSASKNETIPAKGHDFVYYEKYCRNGCGTRNPNYSEQHTTHYYYTYVVKPTGTQIGYTEYYCTCGSYYYSSYTAPTGKIGGLKLKSRNDSSITVTWNKVSGVSGYQIQTCTKDGKKWSTYATLGAGTNTYTFKKLASGNNYKFRCRFFIKGPDGKTYNSPWCATVNAPTLPKSTTLSKLTGAKKSFTAQWKKQAGVTGYQIQYSTNNKFTNAKFITVKNVNTLKAVAKNLSAKKTYYVRVRTYKTINKANYCSTWSKTYSVKTK